MEADPTRMRELLGGLGEVDLVGINDSGDGAPLEVMIRSRKARPVCGACGGSVWSKGYRTVVLVDLPAFGRPVRLRWRKRRWMCPSSDCALRSFIEQDPGIGAVRALLTSRAARWVTVQVGRRGRSVVGYVGGELSAYQVRRCCLSRTPPGGRSLPSSHFDGGRDRAEGAPRPSGDPNQPRSGRTIRWVRVAVVGPDPATWTGTTSRTCSNRQICSVSASQ